MFETLKCGLKQDLTRTFKLFIEKLAKTVHCSGTHADYKDIASHATVNVI